MRQTPHTCHVVICNGVRIPSVTFLNFLQKSYFCLYGNALPMNGFEPLWLAVNGYFLPPFCQIWKVSKFKSDCFAFIHVLGLFIPIVSLFLANDQFISLTEIMFSQCKKRSSLLLLSRANSTPLLNISVWHMKNIPHGHSWHLVIYNGVNRHFLCIVWSSFKKLLFLVPSSK